MAGRWELTGEQRSTVESVLRGARRTDNRGRPWHDTWAVVNGVLWILGKGAQWCWAGGALDWSATTAIRRGNCEEACISFLAAVALIQPNGSMVELAAGSASALISRRCWKRL